MGVSGSGKSLIGRALARRLDANFIDADALHPPENIAKMSRGEPLTDADRGPWLDRVGASLAAAQVRIIIGCSALRRSYRDRIRAAVGAPVTFVHLSGPRSLIAARLAARQGHFMPAALIDSQFATLEPPAPGEHALTVDIDQPPETIVSAIAAALNVAGSS